jgi:hypothetical protein
MYPCAAVCVTLCISGTFTEFRTQPLKRALAGLFEEEISSDNILITQRQDLLDDDDDIPGGHCEIEMQIHEKTLGEVGPSSDSTTTSDASVDLKTIAAEAKQVIRSRWSKEVTVDKIRVRSLAGGSAWVSLEVSEAASMLLYAMALRRDPKLVHLPPGCFGGSTEAEVLCIGLKQCVVPLTDMDPAAAAIRVASGACAPVDSELSVLGSGDLKLVTATTNDISFRLSRNGKCVRLRVDAQLVQQSIPPAPPKPGHYLDVDVSAMNNEGGHLDLMEHIDGLPGTMSNCFRDLEMPVSGLSHVGASDSLRVRLKVHGIRQLCALRDQSLIKSTAFNDMLSKVISSPLPEDVRAHFDQSRFVSSFEIMILQLDEPTAHQAALARDCKSLLDAGRTVRIEGPPGTGKVEHPKAV